MVSALPLSWPGLARPSTPFPLRQPKTWIPGCQAGHDDAKDRRLVTTNGPNVPAPLGLLAELTHRCPLGCPYCSNPLALDKRDDELDTATWARVFREAAGLGVLQVHLSGGEPAARRDLAEIVKAARDAGLYSNLITSAVGLTPQTLGVLAGAGLDHVQISIQDSDEASADHIAGLQRCVRAQAHACQGSSGSWTAPHHQHGGASRQYRPHRNDGGIGAVAGCQPRGDRSCAVLRLGHKNRAALMPTREQADEAVRAVEMLRDRHRGQIVIDAVVPDYYARFPKPCVGGWGRRSLNVTPAGRVLPCHAAEVIPGLEFWNVREHSLADIWRASPAFLEFRGTDWMREPCRSCARRDQDFGGCRCQAFMLTGDARATDPVCHLSADHGLVAQLAAERADAAYEYRRL